MTYLDRIIIDKELLLTFVMTLSRFEFALKHAGYLRGNDRFAEPDWERFAMDIDGRFDKNHTPELARACEYFFLTPPQLQISRDGNLGWSSCLLRRAQTETEVLLDLVRRIGSNLCHGGEYDGRLHKEAAQSEAFLRGALMILDECLRVAPAVQRSFIGKPI